MPELPETPSEVSAIFTDIFIALRDTIAAVVTEISIESATFTKIISIIGLQTTIALLDDIFELYSYEWVIVNRSIQSLNNWIDTLIYEQAQRINTVLYNFDALTSVLIQNFEKQLSQIDNAVSPAYNERMFAIYGRIAEFSVAINAPPSYLEEAIQNARFFAMAIACSAGLSYYQFQSDWDAGVERLLIRISNSISLYRENPQWIKLDIEDSLIKPIFTIEVNNRRQEREQQTILSNDIIDLQNLVTTHKLQTDENSIAIIDLYELKIKPALKEITDNFDSWKNDIYATRDKLVDNSFVSLFLQIIEVAYEARRILGLLDYGGDLLLRINKLTDTLRIEQEDKIGDVATKSYRRLVPEWTAEVKKRLS